MVSGGKQSWKTGGYAKALGQRGWFPLGTSRNRVERWKGGMEGEEGTLLGLNFEGFLGHGEDLGQLQG